VGKRWLATSLTLKALGTPLLLLSLLVLVPGGSAAQPGTGVFTAAETEAQRLSASDPAVIRSRAVAVNFDRLNGLAQTLAALLTLNLFPDTVFNAACDRVEHNRSGTISWVGHLEGIAHSPVYLVIGDELLIGNVTTPDAHYQVRYLGSGLHVVSQIDQSATPPDAEPIPVRLPPADAPQRTPSSAGDDGSIVDILVVYTSSAREAAGGTAAMQALIDLAVTETNAGYANSNVTQRMRLAHTAELAYSAADFESGDVIYHLHDKSDGYIDEVHTLRDLYRADLVALLVLTFADPVGGKAFLMQTVTPGFESWAFSILKQKYAAGYYAFPHETGHNMGCMHDRANSEYPGAFSYSYGYQAPDRAFHTVMAYDCPGHCRRINHWSNPNVSYGSQPTGVSSTEPNSADNRLTLENTAHTVANFRTSLVPPTLSSPTDGANRCDAPPRFTWALVRWATTYHIQVDDNLGFGSPEIDATTGDAEYSGTSPLGLGTYYWRVRASNASAEGEWSPASSFHVVLCDIHAYLPAVWLGASG
jgi:hypothetical protein